MTSERILIFAYRYKEDFLPEHIIEDLQSNLADLEYGDVFEGEYQIWEYPSGKIYRITADREVQNKNYYSPPNSPLWMPLLEEIGIDRDRVANAYKLLNKPPSHDNFFRRIRRLFKA